MGSWPGVTVDKNEGQLKCDENIIIQDLSGIYGLSSYTLEEVVTRGYLVNEKPDAKWLTRIGGADWLVGLIGDGIICGAGAVIGFVPQMRESFFICVR